MKASKLRELIALRDTPIGQQEAALSQYLRDNAEAIAELIEAAEEAAEMKIAEQWKLQEAIAKIKE